MLSHFKKWRTLLAGLGVIFYSLGVPALALAADSATTNPGVNEGLTSEVQDLNLQKLVNQGISANNSAGVNGNDLIGPDKLHPLQPTDIKLGGKLEVYGELKVDSGINLNGDIYTGGVFNYYTNAGGGYWASGQNAKNVGWQENSGAFEIKTGSAVAGGETRIVVAGDGKVGIGTGAATLGALLTLGTSSNAGTLGLAGATNGLVKIGVLDNAGTWTLTLPSSAGTIGQTWVAQDAAGKMGFGLLGVNGGGTGATTFISNGILYGNAANAIQVTSQGGANTILTANGGAPSFSAAPTIGTSVTTPTVIGGIAHDTTLTLQGNSDTAGNTATSANILFKTGNNGATNAMTIRNDGNVGIGTTAPAQLFHISRTTGNNAEIDIDSNGDGKYWGIYHNRTGNEHDGLMGDELVFWHKGAANQGNALIMRSNGTIQAPGGIASLPATYKYVAFTGVRNVNQAPGASFPQCPATGGGTAGKPICYSGSFPNLTLSERQGSVGPNDGQLKTHTLAVERKVSIGLPGSATDSLYNPSLEINQPFFSRMLLTATGYDSDVTQHVKMIVDARGDGTIASGSNNADTHIPDENVGQIGTLSAHPFLALTHGSERMRIGTGGDVTIRQTDSGTAAPSLTVEGSATVAKDMTIIEQVGIGSGNKPRKDFDLRGTALIESGSNAEDYAEHLILKNGNYTTIFGNDNRSSGGTNASYIAVRQGAGDANLWGSGSHNLALQPTGGSVGIGTFSPAALLSISDSVSDPKNYGKTLQITRTPTAGQHVAFVRQGNAVISLGYKPGTNTFGFGAGKEDDDLFSPEIISMDSVNKLVGIGMPIPRKALDVNGEIVATNRLTLAQDTGTSSPTWHMDNSSGSYRIFDQPNINMPGTPRLIIDNTGTVTIGTDTTRRSTILKVNGGVEATGNFNIIAAASPSSVVKKGTHLAYDPKVRGFDIAETFVADMNVEPGDVLVVGKNGMLTKSSRTVQGNIAGVVSTSPAILFEGNQIKMTSTEHFIRGTRPPLALSGRVPVKISLENGPVFSGDLLTISSVPGVAMKANEFDATIGIALEDYSSGISNEKIMVLLNITQTQTPHLESEIRRLHDEVTSLKRQLRTSR